MSVFLVIFRQQKFFFWITAIGLLLAMPVQANDLSSQINTEIYNDLGAFEAAHGAPYSDELALEEITTPLETIEYQPNIGIDRYLVLGSFTAHAYAQNFIDLAGLKDVFIQPVDMNGKRYQRVLAGPMTQEEAVSSKSVANDHGIADSWILRKK